LQTRLALLRSNWKPLRLTVARVKTAQLVAPDFPVDEKVSRPIAAIYFYLTHHLHFNMLLTLKMQFPSPGGESSYFHPRAAWTACCRMQH
jgi:hypothetical protein